MHRYRASWRWVSLQSTYFQKGWVSSCGRRHEISLGKKREKSAPVEERSLSIARLRAPTCRQTASLLQRLSKRICQHSLPEIILPIVSLSIQISCDCLQFCGPIEILVAHNFCHRQLFLHVSHHRLNCRRDIAVKQTEAAAN